MTHLLLVACGGAIGSVGRYLLATWIVSHTADGRFPWGTLAVNLLGCALAGLVAAWADGADWFSQEHRLLLLTGMLGGFTTFSAFGLETLGLLRQGAIAPALAYVMVSVLAGLAAMHLVYSLGR
jgi:fluoride exporter